MNGLSAQGHGSVDGHLDAALARIDRLLADRTSPWDWGVGIDTLCHLEASCDQRGLQALRSLGDDPALWQPAHHVTSLTLRMLAVQRSLGVDPAVMRAACHATLVLGCAGLDRGAGLLRQEAAGLALARALARASFDESDLFGRQRLRVCAILHALARSASEQEMNVGMRPLFLILYEIERTRQATGAGTRWTDAQLLEMIVAESGQPFDPRWVTAVVDVARCYSAPAGPI